MPNNGPARWSLRLSALGLAFALLFALAGTSFLFWSQNFSAAANSDLEIAVDAFNAAQKLKRAEAVAKKREAEEAEAESARIAAEAALVADRDARFATAGLTPAGNDVYYMFADPSKYTCGYSDCAYVLLLAMSGCPNSLYVEAAVTRNGVDIGLANHLAAAVPVEGQVNALLEDFSGSGDGFRITKVDCY
jgi:hypothetical protein